MKKLFTLRTWLFGLCFLLGAAIASAANPVYTLSFEKLTTGTNYNSYTAGHTITCGGVDWDVWGNQSVGNNLRVGGKTTTPTNRTLTSKLPVSSDAISKVILHHDGIGNGKNTSITVNSITVDGAVVNTFANAKTKTITNPTVSSAGTLEFALDDGEWLAQSYFKITVNYQVQITSGSTANNSYLTINSVDFYKSEGGQQKKLESISVKTPPTKTNYFEGEKFNPSGLAITAYYDTNDAEDITYVGNESKFSFNPSLDVALTTSNTSVDITYGEKTASQAITVNEAVKYDVTIANNIVNGTVSANVTEAPEGATVTLNATPAAGYQFGTWDVKDASNNPITVTDNKFTMPAANVTVSATFVEKPATVEDYIVADDLVAEGSTYTGFSNVKKNTAIYAGNTARGNDAIQLRSTNSNSGIVSTTSGGKIKKVVVTWNSNTMDGRELNVYGSNVAFTSATELYNAGSGVTKIGSIVKGTSTELEISDEYTYVGVRSNSGAMYLDGIKFVWDTTPEQVKTLDHITLSGTYQTEFNVGDTFNHEGMTVTASYAEEGVADADVTNLATFSGYDMSQADIQTVTVSYTEKGVTKTATYDITLTEITKYAVNIAEMTNGSVTASPAPAAEGQIVTLTVTPAAHYHISALTVTGASGGEVTVTSNKFTMPAEDVTVSATFEEDAKYTYTWYVNGVVYGDVQTLYKGEAVTKPADPATPEALTGKVFRGWVTKPITTTPTVEPTYATIDATATANRNYYAVFATKTGTGSAGYKKVDLTKLPENPENDAQKRAAYVSYWTSGEYLFVREQDNKYLVFNGSKSESTSQNWIEAGSITTDYIISDDNATNAAKIAFVKVNGENNFFWIKRKNVDDTYFGISNSDGKGLEILHETDLGSTYNKASLEITENECLVHIYEGASTLYFRPGFGFRFHKPDDNVTKNPIWVYEKTEGATYSEWTTGAEVVLRTLESIALSGEYPTVFEVGDRFSHEGMVVTATYDDATTKVVTSKAKFEVNMAQVGEQTVTVSYTEGEVTKTATYTITIKKKSARAYTLVTSQDDIVDGGEYIILSEDGNYAAAVGTNKRIQTEARGENTYKIVDNTVIVSSYSVTRPYFLVATDGGWYLNDGEYNASLNNKTHVEFVEGTQDVFTVSIAADNTAKITAPAVAEDRQIEYHYWTNNGVVSRAFRYYVSENISKEDYQAIKLYKRVNTVVIEDGYRSRYNETTERNLYKNTLTYDVPKANDVLKLYRGETLLGTFNVDAANVNYTFTPENAFDADQTNRFDGEVVALSGNADDGLTITDYYSEFIEANMPEAVRYSLRDADEVEVGVAVVPLYRSTASARVMMDPANNVQGYTADDIVNDNAHAANYQNNVRVDVAHADIDGLSGIKVYRDHVVAGEAGATAEYVDVLGKEVRLSNIFESELAVTSAYGENTYGSPKATVHAALVAIEAHDKEVSKYSFTTAGGKTGHYFSVLADVKLNQPEDGEFELVGVRAWRTCNSSLEPIEQLAGRSNDYNYATILDTDNFTAIEGNEVKNIGSEVISYKDAAGTNFEFGSGVFGSFQEKPTVGLHVRAYYRRAPQSSSAPMQKAPAADGNYYVAETFAEVTFDADVVTGVLDVAGAKEVKSVRYFNIMGVESAEPVDGVNIVVTTYTDGTSSSAKMLR